MTLPEPKPTLLRQELPEQDLAHKRAVGRLLNDVIAGRGVAWVYEVTLLDDGSTTTSLTVESITSGSQVSFQPVTPEAATLMDAVWITAADLVPGTAFTASKIGRLTINHPALVEAAGATFRLSIKG